MGFLTALARTCLDMSVVALLIIVVPGLPPYTTFTEYEYPPAMPWSGPMERNEKLNLVDRLFENQIKGPESFAVKDGYLYTGLMSGAIVRIDPEDLSITPVAKIGIDCADQFEDFKCGRPLGLVFTPAGKLMVADAVFGLYLIDLDRQDENEGRITSYKYFDKVSYEKVLDPQTLVNGTPNVYINSPVIARDGNTVYLTVSSTIFPLRDSVFELLSDSSGRVLQLDLDSKKITVLVDGINYANGIELSPEEDYLLFTEVGRSRIHKYHLKGEKKGICEVLVNTPPGMPDNVKLNDRGNYYVGIINPRLPNTVNLQVTLAPHNIVRKFVLRLVYMVLFPVKVINQILPTAMSLSFEYWCGNTEPVAHLSPPYGLVIEIDGETGEILSSLHSTNGAVRFISEAIVLDRWIYLGSPYTTYLARVPKRLRDATASTSISGVSLGLVNSANNESDVLTDEAETISASDASEEEDTEEEYIFHEKNEL